jgi:protein-tyrosine phosphatase
MKIINKSIYNILSTLRNIKSLNIINRVANIDDYNLIIPNLYLGNIKNSSNVNFLIEKNIQAIINCTEDEPFDEYFDDKLKLRVKVNDSKEPENILEFKSQIVNAINFIDECIDNNKAVYVHCYWGLMRSATVIACYLIKKYNISSKDAINIVKEQRNFALMSIYNFNEVLEFVEDKYRR